MDHPTDKIVVRSSPIHGRGVFAARRIQRGEVTIDWTPCSEVLTDEQVQALPVEEQMFVSIIDGRHILFKPPARFVNHSCNPNARAVEGHDIALRTIEEGEEITIDYVVEQALELGLRALQCNCGAPNCRGVLRPV
jgi:SET domain-containing protein